MEPHLYASAKGNGIARKKYFLSLSLKLTVQIKDLCNCLSSINMCVDNDNSNSQKYNCCTVPK